jgi:hypothetical protein
VAIWLRRHLPPHRLWWGRRHWQHRAQRGGRKRLRGDEALERTQYADGAIHSLLHSVATRDFLFTLD